MNKLQHQQLIYLLNEYELPRPFGVGTGDGVNSNFFSSYEEEMRMVKLCLDMEILNTNTEAILNGNGDPIQFTPGTIWRTQQGTDYLHKLKTDTMNEPTTNQINQNINSGIQGNVNLKNTAKSKISYYTVIVWIVVSLVVAIGLFLKFVL